MRTRMFFGLGKSINISNSFLPFFCNTHLIFLVIVDALDYIHEAERGIQECYDSMDSKMKMFMDDNSMLALHEDELGRGDYYL